jgi:synaptic vesicle membrane protein VAT-1
MQQIWIDKPGAPEVLTVREAPDPEPKPGEVRIRVRFAGVNFADIMGRMGIYPDLPGFPIVVGYEVSGTVDAVGEGVEPTKYLNRRVLALCRFGGYSSVVSLPENQVFVIPDAMSFSEAAALPVNYLTAYQLVVVMGSLRAGETMLVHSAGGGVGIAAIQLAKHIGAHVIGTASAGKHAFLKGIGVDHCIDYTQEPFEKAVMDLTGGQGVELVLDAVGGESYKKSFSVLAPTGRLGMFGMSAAATGKTRNVLSYLSAAANMPWFTFNPVALLNENKGAFGVNMGHMWHQVPRLSGWVAELVGLYEQGVLRPRVDKSFKFAAAAEAHHYMQDRRNIGKILLEP